MNESIVPEKVNEIQERINEYSLIVPPLNSYFNAKVELAKAKKRYKSSVSLNKKDLFKQEVSEIRNKLSRQQSALAKTKELLEESIISGSGTKKELKEIVSEMRKKYHFTNEQLRKINSVIDSYTKYRKDLADYFKSYSSKNIENVFQDLFQVDMKNYPSLSWRMGPLGFEFFADGQTILDLYKIVTSKDVIDIGGFAGSKIIINSPSIYQILYNINMKGPYESVINDHERIHNLFIFFFREIYQINPNYSQDELVELLRNCKKDPEGQKKIYLDFFRTELRNRLYLVADEYLAMLNSRDVERTFKLFELKSKKNSYDYFIEFRNQDGRLEQRENESYHSFSDKEYKKMKKKYRTFVAKYSSEYPELTYVDIKSLPTVYHSYNVNFYFPPESGIKSEEFIFDQDIINEAKTQVFDHEYFEFIHDLNEVILTYLDKNPDKYDFLLNELSIIDIQLWRKRVLELSKD